MIDRPAPRAQRRLQGILPVLASPPPPPKDPTRRCGCGNPLPEVAFDPRDADLPEEVVRRRWPRKDWTCLRCGTMWILYASAEHFIAGDW